MMPARRWAPAKGTGHGFDHCDASLDATARWFQGGEAKLEVVRSDRSGDLAVIVAIERQHGVAGGPPALDWSLRVTLVFRPARRPAGALHRSRAALSVARGTRPDR